MNTTKLTKLTGSQVGALEGHADQLRVEAGKSTATFVGTPAEALERLIGVQNEIAARHGRGHSFVRSTNAVVRKLETMIAEEVPVAPAEDAPAETPEKARLTLVADSTDPESLVAIPGLGRSVPALKTDAEKVEAAQEAADAILSNAGYEKVADGEQPKSAPKKPNSAGDIPTWGTAKHHGLKPGQMFMFYGKDRDAGPKAEGTVRKYELKNGSTTVGGVATRFWAVPLTPKADREAAAASKPEKAAPGKKTAPAKKSAGSRAIPQEAINKARAAWIKENGLETYKKQYNGGWDNATYDQGEKRAKSGDASPAWMDGYTDRKANPGKAGISAKWSALKSDKAPVKKI